MKKFYQKLEMNLILQQLENFAIMQKTQEIIRELKPTSDIELINNLLDETDEALQIVLRLDRAPIMIFSDYESIINIAKKGGMLTGLELYETIRLYATVKANERHLQFLNKDNIPCFFYKNLVESLFVDEFLDNSLRKSIDETGYVLDEASSELRLIRHKLQQIEIRIKNKLQEIIAKESSKLSQAIVSIRNDRYVIPVRSEYKNSIKGTIQDVSASSQTFYIEPAVITQLMFDKQKLIDEEKKELERILRELSSRVQGCADVLYTNYKTIIHIDFVFAKAMLAKLQEASRPEINNKHEMVLVDARHPLLKVDKVIPNNVSFEGYLGIVITGPNTGGKTVLLKTVGLLSLMIKYGLLIPAAPDSKVMIYDDIFCDIGDDQSIQANLSTFSSHMKNIIEIIDAITPNSLVLFDEIGGGTDPTEGFNLAIAILKYLINKRVSFITTTHYSELKAFAYEGKDIINASMEFDQNTLSPTYKLLIGLPGASNAFNIARRLGLKEEIIKTATDNMSLNDSQTVELINKLEQLMRQNIKKEEELSQRTSELKKQQQLYHQKIQQIDQNTQKIYDDAKAQADKNISKITKEANQILEDLKKMQTKEIKLHEIIAVKKALDDLTIDNQPAKEITKTPKREIRMGDDVYVRSYDQYGNVTRVLKPNLYEVAIGNVVINLKSNQVELVENVPKNVFHEAKSTITRVNTNSRVSLSLDLRGKRYEDARDCLEKYLDDISLSGIKQFTIIHGYGTGTIRTLVQDYLKNNSMVSSYRYGGSGEGGMGATVVVLK